LGGIVVANEIGESMPRTKALMQQHGVAAIVPFYPHSKSAASWMLLGESFSEQVYTPLDFKMVEQLFDRLGELFLDKLLFLRAQLHDVREQMQTLQFRLDMAQEESQRLREQNTLLRRRVTALEQKPPTPRQQAAAVVTLVPDGGADDKPLEQYVHDLEARLIARALQRCDGNKAKAARLLGLKPNTLHYKIERYGLTATGTDADTSD
jgi:DNA-binding PucR family transcriptional regulator